MMLGAETGDSFTHVAVFFFGLITLGAATQFPMGSICDIYFVLGGVILSTLEAATDNGGFI